MPRPERPVDPSGGPVPRFAAALRELRTEAGNPPYREMAVKVHTSKASLSAAASGHRLPTLDVTRAYVRACDGDVEDWSRRWAEVRAELGQPPPAPVAAVAEPGRRRWRLLAVAAGLTVVAAVSTVALINAGTGGAGGDRIVAAEAASTEAPARYSGSAEPVADNADPKRSGCGNDPARIVTLDSVQVITSANNLLGVAVLRHSPECRASWGKFEPSDRLKYLPGPASVTVTARRPATGTVGTPFTTAFDGQAVFGAILLDRRGCIEITVEVKAPHGDGSATTACRP